MGRLEMKPTIGRSVASVAALCVLFYGLGAFAQDLKVEGMPVPGGIGLQTPATELAEDIRHLHDILMWIITPITVFGVFCSIASSASAIGESVPTDHAQHAARSGVDGGSGADPGVHRGVLLPAALQAAGDPESGIDHPRHRPPVVLELRVSG
jgi:hypothetical protein